MDNKVAHGMKFIPTSTEYIESAAEATANVIFETLFKDNKGIK